MISAKLAYQSLLSKDPTRSEWWYQIWDWKIPLQISICCWLALENCLLSWDNLIRRGISSLSICLLCGQNEESIFHLFVACSHCILVWKRIGLIINDNFPWSEDSLSTSFCCWCRKYPGWKTLPCFILWELWRYRNLIIFEGNQIYHSEVANKGLKAFIESRGISPMGAWFVKELGCQRIWFLHKGW